MSVEFLSQAHKTSVYLFLHYFFLSILFIYNSFKQKLQRGEFFYYQSKIIRLQLQQLDNMEIFEEALGDLTFHIIHTDLNKQNKGIRNYLTLTGSKQNGNMQVPELIQIPQPENGKPLQTKDNQHWKLQLIPGFPPKFRIKNLKNTLSQEKPLFLTLSKISTKNGNQFHTVTCQPLDLSENGKYSQIWAFHLGKDQRFRIVSCTSTQYCIGTDHPKEIEENLEEKNRNICYCRPFLHYQIENQYSQYWKFSIVENAQNQNLFSANQKLAPQKIPIQLIHFSGAFFLRDQSPQIIYKQATLQYATTSYPVTRMEPFVVAYPNNQEDIILMIDYAQNAQKKVVVRSGGHQYCGLSSGGQDTILISMNKFTDVVLKNDRIQVGPCVQLLNLSKFMLKHQVSIPHGQCPKVNIGGHQ